MSLKHNLVFVLLILMPISTIIAAPMTPGNYWQCTTYDNQSKQWSARNVYQKMALNIAYDMCKKESQNPASCKSSINECEGFNQGISISPQWRCTAIDREAIAWQSNFYTLRDDAAFAAKDYCMANSQVPETCYLNFVTCRNFNEGAAL